MNQQLNIDHPILIFVRGLPGSGKSHLTTPLAQAVSSATGKTVVTLDPDATDYDSPAYTEHVAQLTTEGIDPALFAYRYLRGQAYDAITNNGVAIWNQPFTNLEIFNKMVARMNDQAAEANTHVAILVVEVGVDPDLARKRVADRKAAGGHGPSNATFERFVNDYHGFAQYGYTTVQVNGTDDPATSIDAIMDSLRTFA